MAAVNGQTLVMPSTNHVDCIPGEFLIDDGIVASRGSGYGGMHLWDADYSNFAIYAYGSPHDDPGDGVGTISRLATGESFDIVDPLAEL